MKLATFDAGGGAGPEVGVVCGSSLVPLTRALPTLARDMTSVIRNWDRSRTDIEAAVATGGQALEIDSVRLLAPAPRPGKIFCIGLNYRDHIAESGMPTPEKQVWFTKAQTAVAGPYDPIQIPRVSEKVDYEVELVVIVGRGGKHLSRSDAPGAVFGYCVGNDVTARDWQLGSPQWSLGKSFDTHAPFGPWITTADEAGDPHGRAIRCFVNGEQRQASNTRELLFDVWAQIEYLSKAMTLEPGDVLFTGTPAGVGMADGRLLRPGDVVRCEADGLGHIENVCVAEPDHP